MNISIKILKNEISIIFKLALLKKTISTFKLAKYVFEPKTNYEKKKCDIKIRQILEKYSELGILKKEIINNRKYYSINDENVIISEAYLVLNKKKFDLGNVIGIKINDEWIIFQITDSLLNTKI